MNLILVLVALGALSGFVAGRLFSWPALVIMGLGLATLAAVALQRQDFAALPGISIIVACLAVNQAAYMIAIWLKNEDYLPQQGSDDIPRDRRNDDIHREQKRH